MVLKSHVEIGSEDMGEIGQCGGSDEPIVLVLLHDGREPEQAMGEPQSGDYQFGRLLFEYCQNSPQYSRMDWGLFLSECKQQKWTELE